MEMVNEETGDPTLSSGIYHENETEVVITSKVEGESNGNVIFSREAPLERLLEYNGDEVLKAKAKTKVSATVICVPSPFKAKIILEAKVDLAICITERIPQHGMVIVKASLNKQSKTQLIGPNYRRIIKPGECKNGIMPEYIYKPGHIEIISRSGTLTYEAIFQTTVVNLRQSTCVGIGADTFNGMKLDYCIEKFLANPHTESGIKNPIGASIESCNHHIWQAIRASSTSSDYLDDYTGGVYHRQDGAIVANNPINFTVQEAQLLWHHAKIDFLVSIWCGSIPTKVHRGGWHYLDTGQVLIGNAYCVDRVEKALSALLLMLPSVHYFRFSHVDDHCGIELYETDPIIWLKLEDASEEYTVQNQVQEDEMNETYAPLALPA
ncbi:unnamed protein product [Fraxinus pennsylvanica]|uniref:ATP-citrate synthase/succinyl-CoA ligase C-terminal domain-containing protein n=1 Tax=Fraxinus pennsylvanica TaxID=56036 RepID=A0AAD1YYL5_9LAMI|nr:unnamed protein product [Fraxinus pennsylvanica]